MKTRRRNDLLAVIRADQIDSHRILEIANLTTDTHTHIGFDGDQAAVEQSIKCRRETQAVSRVSATLMINAPRHYVTSH